MITEQELKEKTPKRFWKKINFGEINDCWEWMACRSYKGYGQFGLPKEYKLVISSRYVFMKVYPNFNPDLQVLHNCPNGDNPACCNPNHLWQGTPKDNMDDMIRKGRDKKGDRRGTNNGCNKLIDNDILTIKATLSNRTKSALLLAKEYGVTPTTIYRVKNGKSWTHVQI